MSGLRPAPRPSFLKGVRTTRIFRKLEPRRSRDLPRICSSERSSRAAVGIDNIDIPAATALGIAVINAPAGNTVSVAELFFGSLISLLRHLPDAATSMRDGRWDRSALLGSELRGRTVGIIGLGRIG